jgi:hypothetical protein
VIGAESRGTRIGAGSGSSARSALAHRAAAAAQKESLMSVYAALADKIRRV